MNDCTTCKTPQGGPVKLLDGSTACRACAAQRLNLKDGILRAATRVTLIPIPDVDVNGDHWTLFCHAMNWYPLNSGRRAWAPDLASYVRGADYVVFNPHLDPTIPERWLPEPNDLAYAEDVIVLPMGEVPDWLNGAQAPAL